MGGEGWGATGICQVLETQVMWLEVKNNPRELFLVPYNKTNNSLEMKHKVILFLEFLRYLDTK